MNNNELIQIAREAQKNAYSPYSNFKVGAALITREGEVFSGANVENASYGLTVCAERVAVFKAISTGEREFTALIVVGSGEGFIYPCGACLQVIAEFSPDIKIIVTNEKDEYREYALGELLPQLFCLDR